MHGKYFGTRNGGGRMTMNKSPLGMGDIRLRFRPRLQEDRTFSAVIIQNSPIVGAGRKQLQFKQGAV